MNIEGFNAPGYQTRVSPTAIVLLEYKNNIYSVLVKNKNSLRGYVFPNGKREDTDISSEAAAMREFTEEVGYINQDEKTKYVYLGSLGHLYRKSGTNPISETEEKVLNSRSLDQKFLFVKKQEYHVYYRHLQQSPFIQESNDEGIEDRKIIKIVRSDYINFHEWGLNLIEIGTDLLVLVAITEVLYDKINYPYVSIKDIELISKKLDCVRNTLFS